MTRIYRDPPSPRFGVPRQEPIEGAKLRKRRVVRNPAPEGIGQYMKPVVGLGQARTKKKRG